MTDIRKTAEDCTTMAEVRAGVDSIDRELSRLLGERFRFMEAAARIKPRRELVRDEPRKAQVIANVRAHAEADDYPPDVAAALWELLVEASISHEMERFDARR